MLEIALLIGAVARARWSEDCLESACRDGTDQFVVVGAGLDSFALRRRDLMKSLTVFELDHPATQRAKRERLAQLGVELPKELEFVPIDFECESLDEALARSSFSPERRSFHSWMETVAYLTDEAIFDILGSIARASAAGSELVLDFVCRMEDVRPEHRPAVEKLLRYTARRGWTLITGKGIEARCVDRDLLRDSHAAVATAEVRSSDTWRKPSIALRRRASTRAAGYRFGIGCFRLGGIR